MILHSILLINSRSIFSCLFLFYGAKHVGVMPSNAFLLCCMTFKLCLIMCFQYFFWFISILFDRHFSSDKCNFGTNQFFSSGQRFWYIIRPPKLKQKFPCFIWLSVSSSPWVWMVLVLCLVFESSQNVNFHVRICSLG